MIDRKSQTISFDPDTTLWKSESKKTARMKTSFDVARIQCYAQDCGLVRLRPRMELSKITSVLDEESSAEREGAALRMISALTHLSKWPYTGLRLPMGR